MFMGGAAAIADAVGHFLGEGPFGELMFRAPLTISSSEAHLLAVLLGALLWKGALLPDRRLFHALAAAVHVVLGGSNLLFFEDAFARSISGCSGWSSRRCTSASPSPRGPQPPGRGAWPSRPPAREKRPPPTPPTLGIALWVGSFRENPGAWHLVGVLSRCAPLAANFLFWNDIERYGITHAGIAIHLTMMALELGGWVASRTPDATMIAADRA